MLVICYYINSCVYGIVYRQILYSAKFWRV